MENKKVVGIDYNGYILYEDDTPAFNSHYVEVINKFNDNRGDKADWDLSKFPIETFTKVILTLKYDSLEDGFDYVFNIPMFLEAKLIDTNNRDNIYKSWTFNDKAKYFTPIKVGEHNVDIPMLKTETKDEWLSRQIKIKRERRAYRALYAKNKTDKR